MESSHKGLKKSDDDNAGPYRATRLWNDVIVAFRQFMPVGRHRRYMKTFDDCFSGSAAADWLLQYLKTHGSFTSEVSRTKAVSLLHKLYRTGIFEEVKVSKNMRHKPEVQENRLYRFSAVSPSKLKISRLPLAPRNDAGVNLSAPLALSPVQKKAPNTETTKKPEVSVHKLSSKLPRKISFKRDKHVKKELDPVDASPDENYPPCHLIKRILTTKEIKDTWKNFFLQRLRKTLGVQNLGDLINENIVDGFSVMHNCVYLNKSGVVTNIEPQDQLPHWVMSAMKCLAKWPEPPEPGLPNYPGFEKDVFTVVKDYFMGLQEPLVPYFLYEVITSVFVMAGNTSPQRSPSGQEDEESDIPNSLWTSASLENIILNLTKKYCLGDSTHPHSNTLSNEDLRQAGSRRAHLFESQEDLRFIDHVDHTYRDYDLSAYPSTDGMDRLGHRSSHNPFFTGLSYGLGTQDSWPALPSLPSHTSAPWLSRTVHSAGEATSFRQSNLVKASRKFDSTPDLVSRYETVFGPDNRTVTRVYYQKSNPQLDKCGNDDDYPNEETHRSQHNFGNQSEHPYNNHGTTMNSRLPDSNPKSIQERDYARNTLPHPHSRSHLPKGQSVESLHRLNRTRQEFSPVREAEVERSRSFIQVSPASSHSRPRSRSSANLPDGITEQRKCEPSPSLQPRKSTDTSFEGSRSLDRDTAENSILRNGNKSLNHNITHHGSSRQLSESYREAISEENEYMNLASYHTASRSYFSKGRDLKKSSPELRDRPDAESSLNRSRIRSYPSAGSLTGAEPCPAVVSVVSTPKLFNAQEEQPILSSPMRTTSVDHVSAFGPGYRPVLDASKERLRPMSTADLPSLTQAPTKHRSAVSLRPSLSHVTSTPLSPSLSRARKPSNLFDFDEFTPMCNPVTTGPQRGSTTVSQSGAFLNFPRTRLSENRAKTSLQLICLLIPPANRRKLHLLFKMMVKMTSNPNLCLDPTQSTRSLVLGTFYKAILRCELDDDLDELVVLQLVSFMLDFYADIFTPPPDMKSQVSDRLKLLQRPQVVYSPRPVTQFCRQTSITEFETQQKTTSLSALEELLERIVADQNMSGKDKRKRLKQFQKTYPAIYTRRFPTPEAEAQVLPPRPKVKQPLISRPLNKLKGLRL